MLNTEASHTAQKDGKKTRQRKIRVCTECRKRKQRCDQGLPCHNCTRRYPPVLCTYVDSSKPSNKGNQSPESIVELGGEPQKPKGLETGDSLALRTAQQVSRPYESINRESDTDISLRQSRRTNIAPDRRAALVRRQNAREDASLRKGISNLEFFPVEYAFPDLDVSDMLRVDRSSPYYPPTESLRIPALKILHLPVGNDAIEPLRYLPIEPSRRNAELMHFFVQRLSAFMSSIDGRDPPDSFMNMWMPFMIQSPFIICIAILAASYFQAVALGIDVNKAVDAVSIKVKLISLINEHITTHSKGVSDEAICAVMSLAYNELAFADQTSSVAHMKGLREMIKTRGGIKNITTNPLHIMLKRTDYQIACTFECDPILQGIQEVPILSTFPIELDSPLLLSSNRFVDFMDVHDISTETATILDDMKFITTSAISLIQGKHPKLAEMKFLATVRWIHQKLTSSEPEAHLANDFMYQTIRAAAIIYSTVILSGQSFSISCTSQLLQNLWKMMWRVPLSRWKKSPGLFSWVVLTVTPFTRSRPEGRFLKGLLAANIIAIGIIDWDSSEAILRTYLALQRWLRDKGLGKIILETTRGGIPEGGIPAWSIE